LLKRAKAFHPGGFSPGMKGFCRSTTATETAIGGILAAYWRSIQISGLVVAVFFEERERGRGMGRSCRRSGFIYREKM
jgi:hypothetical protein